MEWISVKDRLPENKERILVYGKIIFNGMAVTSAKYYKKDEFIQDAFVSNNKTVFGVTNWMPLPEPPKL